MSVKQPESAELKSEKTKDIRSTNIIAARGTLSLNSRARIANPHHFCSCRRCCPHLARTPWYGQDGKFNRFDLECSWAV